jgi:hypothetical protein
VDWLGVSRVGFIADHVHSHAADARWREEAQVPYQGAVGFILFLMADLSLRTFINDNERNGGR